MSNQEFTKPADRLGSWYTSYIEVNGVRVRLVVQQDEDGTEYVVVDADNGYLTGEEPGIYYPEPGTRPTGP